MRCDRWNSCVAPLDLERALVTLHSFFGRFLSLCNLKLGKGESALEWARQAAATDPSKKSLFSLFQVELEKLLHEDTSTGAIEEIIEQLKLRDDFEIADLVAFAKVAHDATKPAAVLSILDEMCSLVCKGPGAASSIIPVGILLQHTAQLAQKSASEDNLPLCIETFEKYARMLLGVSSTAQTPKLSPPSVTEWFYATW